MRRSGALLVLLVCTSATGALAKHAPQPKAPAAAPLRITVVSGTPQRGRAWVSVNVAGFETEYPKALVARVRGGPDDIILRFRCITAGCRFTAAEQGDNTDNVDHVGTSYKVTPVKGVAKLMVTLLTDAPGTFVVLATPTTANDDSVAARFVLTAE